MVCFFICFVWSELNSRTLAKRPYTSKYSYQIDVYNISVYICVPLMLLLMPRTWCSPTSHWSVVDPESGLSQKHRKHHKICDSVRNVQKVGLSSIFAGPKITFGYFWIPVTNLKNWIFHWKSRDSNSSTENELRPAPAWSSTARSATYTIIIIILI